MRVLIFALQIHFLLQFNWNADCVRPSGFENFISNGKVKEILEKYDRQEIKTFKQLHENLNEAGIDVSLRTLERYVGQIKVQFIK